MLSIKDQCAWGTRHAKLLPSGKMQDVLIKAHLEKGAVDKARTLKRTGSISAKASCVYVRN